LYPNRQERKEKVVKNKLKIDEVSPGVIKFFGGKKELIAFLNAIVKQGGEMLAAEALGHEWWDVDAFLENDPALRNLVERQKLFIAKKADEILCNRSMNGFEEVVEEHGEIVKKSRKFNDRALLEYLKANHPKYRKDAADEAMPLVEVKRFEMPRSDERQGKRSPTSPHPEGV